MSLFQNLFRNKKSDTLTNIGITISKCNANCKADIIEPYKQDSMFPTYVIVTLLPDGLSLNFDSKHAETLDNFSKPAVIGQYHWINGENDTTPFVMSYKDVEKISCHFYKTKDNMTSYVSSTTEIVKEIPKGIDLEIVFVYHNRAKGTQLFVRFELQDAKKKIDNKATCKMYNAMLLAKSS